MQSQCCRYACVIVRFLGSDHGVITCVCDLHIMSFMFIMRSVKLFQQSKNMECYNLQGQSSITPMFVHSHRLTSRCQVQQTLTHNMMLAIVLNRSPYVSSEMMLILRCLYAGIMHNDVSNRILVITYML